ncbi:hypothetical protein [Marinitoga lauensis]|uniref:hypothetical protein n=1 Tax=Marinitoga lauensis TaxID=2201189 RepID=UPI001F0E7624
MTINELAKTFKVNRFVIYRIIYKLEDLGEHYFMKKGKNYSFSKKDIDLLKLELEKLGYTIK